MELMSPMADESADDLSKLSDARGFAAATYSHQQMQLDLNRHLIAHPASTFFMRVSAGDAVIQWGVREGDLLIIDRSLRPQSGDLAVVQLEGELCLRRMHHEGERWRLEGPLSSSSSGSASTYQVDAGRLAGPGARERPTLEARVDRKIEGRVQQEPFELWGVVCHAIHYLRGAPKSSGQDTGRINR